MSETPRKLQMHMSQLGLLAGMVNDLGILLQHEDEEFYYWFNNKGQSLHNVDYYREIEPLEGLGLIELGTSTLQTNRDEVDIDNGKNPHLDREEGQTNKFLVYGPTKLGEDLIAGKVRFEMYPLFSLRGDEF